MPQDENVGIEDHPEPQFMQNVLERISAGQRRVFAAACGLAACAVLILPFAPSANAQISESFNNPVYTNYLADPFCWYHNGTYYAVGTRGGGKHDPARDVPMIKSRDLQHWDYVGQVLEVPADECGGLVWAPETAFHDGTFYLYYHANGNGKGFRVRAATSKNPEGPYRDTGTPLTDVAQNDFVIDSSAFRDDDGQWYLFYATDFTNSDATTFRGTALAVDRLIDMTRLEGKPTTVMRAHWQWQVYERNRNMRGKVADWYTLEAPEVVKRNGKYYCFYSGGNYQNDSYGVDYLVADNIRGPWAEVGRERGPQIVRSIPGKVFGPGHNSIVSSPDGKDYFVYHAWNPERTKRQVWVDPLVWTPNGPMVERFQGRIAEMNQKAAAAK
jgi:beta-xylosidase